MALSLWGAITWGWCDMATVPDVQCWRSNHNQMCCNMGVVQHGNSPRCPMLEKQPQTDVLWYFKGLMDSFRIEGRMQHVYGHAEEYLLEAKMSQHNGKLLGRQTSYCSTHCGSGSKWSYLKHLPVIKSLRRDCWGMGYRIPNKCDHWALERTSSASTVWQMGGGKEGELPICLLGRHGACNEIVPRDVPRLGNKTCITFSRD